MLTLRRYQDQFNPEDHQFGNDYVDPFGMEGHAGSGFDDSYTGSSYQADSGVANWAARQLPILNPEYIDSDDRSTSDSDERDGGEGGSGDGDIHMTNATSELDESSERVDSSQSEIVCYGMVREALQLGYGLL